jgi:hypothetical protein
MHHSPARRRLAFAMRAALIATFAIRGVIHHRMDQ